MLEHACAHKLEGLISKRRDAPYRSGRNENWVKSKCGQNQEFVIVGYKDASHLKGAIGALVLGYNEDGKLRYAGRSGTGYTMETARDLWKKLQPLRRDEPAFGKIPEEERGRKGIWVEPKLVAEVTFRGFTAQGMCVTPCSRDCARTSPRGKSCGRRRCRRQQSAKKAAKPAKAAREGKPAQTAAPVKLTHPDRVYWTDAGITKQQLADYYTAVWDHMAPHVVNRPLALVRCPEGVDGQCFFQKHAAAGPHQRAHPARIKDSQGEELIYIEDLDGLLTLVQAGVLEIHVWGSTIGDIEHATASCSISIRATA